MRKLKYCARHNAICARHKVIGENVNEIFNDFFANRCEVVDKIKDKNHSNDDCLRYVK